MPQVRILCDVAGPRSLWVAGDIVEMTPEQAAIWADGIRGELVPPAVPVKTPTRR